MKVGGQDYLKINTEMEFFKNKIMILQSRTNEGTLIIKESLINQIELFIHLIQLTKLQISMLCNADHIT